jgi:hypothetical protein
MDTTQKGAGIDANQTYPIIITPANLVHLYDFLSISRHVEIGNKLLPRIARKFSLSTGQLILLMTEFEKKGQLNGH